MVIIARNPRKQIPVPEDSNLFKMISDMEKSKPKSKPIWKCVEETLIEHDKDAWVNMVFDEFVIKISLHFPEKKKIFQKLWGLIVLRIIREEPLKEEYIKDIEKIMR